MSFSKRVVSILALKTANNVDFYTSTLESLEKTIRVEVLLIVVLATWETSLFVHAHGVLVYSFLATLALGPVTCSQLNAEFLLAIYSAFATCWVRAGLVALYIFVMTIAQGGPLTR